MTKAWWFSVLALLGAPAFAVPQWTPAGPLATAKSALPAHLRGLADLPRGSVMQMRAGADKALGAWELQLPDGSRYAIANPTRIEHPNGDVTYSGTLAQAGALYPVLLTVGRDASFGTWRTPQGVYRFESWGDQGWLIDAGHPQLQVDGLAHDFVVPPADEVVPSATAPTDKATSATIDVLFLYSAGFAARYPGTAAETRTRHLVAVANQVLANSAVDLVLRATAIEQTAYTDIGDNGAALADLRNAVRGNAVAGLTGLAARRAATGADLVTLMRPHDIETRGSCGIAYLFRNDASFGVNVLSDGFDSWSLCDDPVFAHEVGHNLGAEHQLGQSSAQPGYGTAHIVLGRLHTVMGSFGSGTPDRGLRLLRFSNPQQLCGGAACGTDNLADNARRLRDNMARVAGYANATSTEVVSPPPAQDPDTDGDGVPESADAFPHDPRWQSDRDGDGVADPVDRFPDDNAETTDLDGDGIGDNADPDRDGDGVANGFDFLPDDRRDTQDRDLDMVGDTTDAFPDDRREWSDTDRDGTGDNADADTDGDGVPDLQPGAADLLVISDGTGRVVRLDGGSGLYGGVEWVETHTPQAFGPNGALAWNPAQKRLYGLIGGAVLRFDRAARTRIDRYIESYREGIRPGMPSGLAAGFAVDLDGTVYVGETAGKSFQRFDPITGAQLPGPIFGDGAFFPAAPREFALTPDGRRLWTIDRDSQLREIDLVRSQQLAAVTPTLNGAPAQNPSALAVAADGTVLIAERDNDRVLRFDPAQPQAMTELIARGSGGLRAPAGIAVDAAGRLYVASAGSDAVLRYAADGTFLGVFSRTPPGVLRTPRALTFVPKIADRWPLDRARAFQPQPGGWNNPQRAGHGLDLQRVGDTLAVTWYTYDDDGDPVWYLGVADLQGDRWDAPLLRHRWDGQRASSVDVGRAQLRFTSEYAATFDWQLGARSGSEPMQPVQAGTSSDTQFPTAAWFRAEQPGWGLTVSRQGELAYAVAFFYDRAGEPTWLLGATAASDAMTFPLGRSHGPTRCPGCSGSAEPVAVPAGELRFDVQDIDRANVTVNFEGADLAWPRGTHAFSRLTDTPTERDGDPVPR